MIGRLTGKVVAQEPDGTVVLDVGGVGYELAVPLGTLGRARADDAGRVTLWVHTHVREDALSLFGFSDQVERAAFRALLSVSNVGPKIAVGVLGALPASELVRAVARRDLRAMTGIPGVGKKIAERLLLELRDKLTEATVPGGDASAAPGPAPQRPALAAGDRVRSALIGMGFKQGEAERAVSALDARDGEMAFEDMLRDALSLLAK